MTSKNTKTDSTPKQIPTFAFTATVKYQPGVPLMLVAVTGNAAAMQAMKALNGKKVKGTFTAS